jgi:predicted metal-dependent hydrolase
MIALRASRYQPGDRIEVAGSPVRLRVDRRARRISLRLDPARREMIATAPSVRRLAEAAAFAETRAGWMAELLARLPDGEPLVAGATIEVLGRPCRLVRVEGRQSPGVIEGGDLVLKAAGDADAFSRAATRALKAYALKVLTERTAAHAAALRVGMPEVKVMDARSRWGSCRPPRHGDHGRVRYSWRLVLAPWEVMDYVAAHEAAHLVRADHSPHFWAEVRKLVKDDKPARAWLRAHGQRLHAVGR